jgi:hypothetical protein
MLTPAHRRRMRLAAIGALITFGALIAMPVVAFLMVQS